MSKLLLVLVTAVGLTALGAEAKSNRKPAAAVGGSGIVCDFSASMADTPGDEVPKRFAVSTYGEKLGYKGLEVVVKHTSGLNVAIKYPDGTRASLDTGGKLHLMQFVALGGDSKEQINYELECR
jgi:hypothetical protein